MSVPASHREAGDAKKSDLFICDIASNAGVLVRLRADACAWLNIEGNAVRFARGSKPDAKVEARRVVSTEWNIGRTPSGDREKLRMRHSILVSSAAIRLSLGLSAPVFAAQPPAADPASKTPPAARTPTDESAAAKNVTAVQPAEKCLADVRSFSAKMNKDGYWLGGSDYGYGFPMGGYGYGYGYPMGTDPASVGYSNARPGYEVRTLIASADILAQRGQQQPCEDNLAIARTVYQDYAAEMHGRGVSRYNGPKCQQQQIASAKPVTSENTAFRSDQLLDATAAALKAAPQVSDDQFAAKGAFDKESAKVDTYWKTQALSTARN